MTFKNSKYKLIIKPSIWWLPKRFRGITTPFNRVYVVDTPHRNKTIIHESVHVQQIQQLGKIRFFLSYLCESVMYGYSLNKYELEARKLTKMYIENGDIYKLEKFIENN